MGSLLWTVLCVMFAVFAYETGMRVIKGVQIENASAQVVGSRYFKAKLALASQFGFAWWVCWPALDALNGASGGYYTTLLRNSTPALYFLLTSSAIAVGGYLYIERLTSTDS